MKNVEVGLWRLPGIHFEQGELSPELNAEMTAWAEAEGVGMSMSENLWSFKKEAHREWFILRWSDSIPKPAEKEHRTPMISVAPIVVTAPAKKPRKPRAKKTP